MPRFVGALRDMKIAAAVGIVAEALLALRAFKLGGNLVGRHPWLEISQMPGAPIAERVFNHRSVSAALTFAVIFQGATFTIIALGMLYGYRVVRNGMDNSRRRTS